MNNIKITIINGTNRKDNESMQITLATQQIAKGVCYEAKIVTLDNFSELFQGTHITPETADEKQKADVENISSADILLFVVPTYHHGIPASLKNFMEIVKPKDMYNNKVIGFISSNNSFRDFGAHQAAEVMNGIISYNKLRSFVMPRITIIDHGKIDEQRIKEFIEYCASFTS